ncbi:MAG: cytochrome [Caulobacteraceae bacterium]|jgi:cytochrome c|nr:cytochrome [Caulobacteraceae bacterium]
MKTLISAAAAAGALLALASPSMAADASHGQMLFKTQCGVCHQAGEGDGDGGQGPSLKGVVGRKIGGDENFSYTQVMMDDKDKWTQESLAAFLENPQKTIPGNAMPIRVGAPADRADIAAYLATVKAAP